RPCRLEAADAAAQRAVSRKGDERGARLLQPGGLDGLRGTEEPRLDGRARDGEQRLACIVGGELSARLIKRKRGVAHHLAFAARRVARIARRKQLDAEV